MKPSEATVILTKIAAYDRRSVGEADAAAWAEALDGLVTLQDALTAVRDHFRASNDWLMPKAIIDRSRELRKRRIRDSGLPDFPPDLTQAQEREWLRAYHDALAEVYPNRYDTGSAMNMADRALGINRVNSKPADPERVRKLIADFAASRAIEAAS